MAMLLFAAHTRIESSSSHGNQATTMYGAANAIRGWTRRSRNTTIPPSSRPLEHTRLSLADAIHGAMTVC